MQLLSGIRDIRTVAHLMLWPHAIDLEALCQLIEATVQIVAKLHEVFDVVHCREIDLQQPVGTWALPF